MLSKKKTNTFTLKFMAALGRHDKNASKGWTIQDSINRNAYFSWYAVKELASCCPVQTGLRWATDDAHDDIFCFKK